MLDAAEAAEAQRFASFAEEQGRVKTRARGLAQGYGLRECGSRKNEAD
jgi:hypothetical protein